MRSKSKPKAKCVPKASMPRDGGKKMLTMDAAGAAIGSLMKRTRKLPRGRL